MTDLKNIAPYKTEEQIHNDWRAALLDTSDTSRLPKGWTRNGILYNMSRATAYVLRSFYDWMTNNTPGESGFLKQAFLVTAQGDALDLHASNHQGLARREATSAVIEVEFTRRPGSTGDVHLPDTTYLYAVSPSNPVERLVFSANTSGVFIPDGEDTVTVSNVEAEFSGSAYNVADDTELLFFAAITNVQSARAVRVVTHGVDREEDESLRLRIIAASDTGLVPGAKRYEAWALEVPGVAFAKVTAPSRRGTHAVDITIAPAAGDASVEEVAATIAYINARKAVTDDVQVYGVSSCYISFSVTLFTPKGSGLRSQFSDLAQQTKNALLACFSLSNNLNVSAFSIGEDVTLDKLREAVFTVIPSSKRQRLVFGELTGTSGSYDAAGGVYSVPAAVVPRAGTITVTVEEAAEY